MKNYLLKFMGLVCIIATLVGCAPPQIDLAYHSNANLGTSQPNVHQKPLYVEQTQDLRSTAPTQITTIKFVNYTPQGIQIVTPVTYYSIQPVANTLTTALKESLTNAGYKTTDNNQALNLKLSISDLTYSLKTGFFKSSLTATLIAQFKLVDTQHNKILWSHSLIGNAKCESFSVDIKTVKEVFTKAADNVFEQLVQDESFKNAIH